LHRSGTPKKYSNIRNMIDQNCKSLSSFSPDSKRGGEKG
jgi:hypothetical protein